MNLRTAFVSLALLLTVSAASAQGFETEVSTQPLGSPYYRHLAFDFNLDLQDLVKLEKRGFGRNEVVTIILISKATGTSFKDYAKRRLKDKVLLKVLAAEAQLDYATLIKNTTAIKEGIEAKGDKNLPPPQFEPTPTPTSRRSKRKGKAAETPSPTPSPTSVEYE